MKTTDFVKFVRAKIKSYYPEKKECYVTGKTTDLEIHHLYCLSKLVEEFRKFRPDFSEENKEQLRDEFLAKYSFIYDVNLMYVLTKEEHLLVHRIFGWNYEPRQYEDVRNFINKRREKLYGKY